MVEIVLKNQEVIIRYKPSGIPTQSDTSGDSDAMTMTAEILRSLGENDALWLVHRLDRVVAGLVVFARNKKSAAELSALVGGKGMEKEYLAVVEGEAKGGEMTDYIFKDSAKGKAFVVNGGRKGAKLASLEYIPLDFCETERGARTLVKIKLHTGRFHQIRVQFASRSLPLVGDGKYGSHDNRAKMPALFASHLGFEILGKSVDAKIKPDIQQYPWSIFKKENYDD